VCRLNGEEIDVLLDTYPHLMQALRVGPAEYAGFTFGITGNSKIPGICQEF
jgi:hypothetical protein